MSEDFTDMVKDVIKFPGGEISGWAEAGLTLTVVLIGWGLKTFLQKADKLPDININGGNIGPKKPQ